MGEVRVIHETSGPLGTPWHSIVVHEPITDGRKILVLTDAEWLQLKIEAVADSDVKLSLDPWTGRLAGGHEDHSGHSLDACLRQNLLEQAKTRTREAYAAYVEANNAAVDLEVQLRDRENE